VARDVNQPLPPSARVQIEQLVGSLREILAHRLVGVYLHGSLAMGCFNPARSDVDLLVVTRRGMAVQTKRRVAELLLRASLAPHPIEISFLRQKDLIPWEYPTPFDFHYGESWRARYREQLANDAWRRWNDREHRHRDVDLAAHLTITRQRGVRLHGPAIEQVFPVVPHEHYLASILDDFAAARDTIARDPVYGVLNLCRVYWHLLEGRVSSKAEAGAWAVSFVPPDHRPVVAQALALYDGRTRESRFDDAELARFARYVDDAVTGMLNTADPSLPGAPRAHGDRARRDAGRPAPAGGQP